MSPDNKMEPKGQTSLEYLMIAVVAILVVVAVLFFTQTSNTATGEKVDKGVETVQVLASPVVTTGNVTSATAMPSGYTPPVTIILLTPTGAAVSQTTYTKIYCPDTDLSNVVPNDALLITGTSTYFPIVEVGPDYVIVEGDATWAAGMDFEIRATSGFLGSSYPSTSNSTISASRTLPATYTPGSPVGVSLAFYPSSNLIVYFVEETVPAGWTVSGLTNDGVWYSSYNLIRWGPFNGPGCQQNCIYPPPANGILTYQATPPAGTTGTKVFLGMITYDEGYNQTIGGYTHIEQGAVNGLCGSAAKIYSVVDTFPAGAFCLAGTPSSSSPADPPIGGSTSWGCRGQNGGTTVGCTAKRTAGINGLCGSTANTCAAGTYGPGPSNPTTYRWWCNGINGGYMISCTMAKNATAACGTANGLIYSITMAFPGSYTLCTPGTPSPASPVLPNTIEATTSWQCLGVDNETAACSARRDVVINGMCDLTLNTCILGTLNDIPDNSTQYIWQCVGTFPYGTTASCSMPKSVVNGACGPAAGEYINNQTFPAGAYCFAGTTVPAFPSNPPMGGSTSWQCVGVNGGATANCSAWRAASINGQCGSTLNSCISGSLYDAADNSTHYLWECGGLYGGVTAFCSMPKAVINGACGTAARAYPKTAPFPGNYTLCSAGTPSPASPASPPVGGSTSWVCLGLNGGQNSLICVATRPATSSINVSRTLPATYTPGSPTSVSLTASMSDNLIVYIVEDTVPAGWTVSGLTNGAVWTPAYNLIRWPPFSGPGSPIDPGPATKIITYQATPPAGTTGTKTFSGAVSYDEGYSHAIGGATTIAQGAPVNGICGNATNTCLAGTFQDLPDNGTLFRWQCLGVNGGTTAQCSLVAQKYRVTVMKAGYGIGTVTSLPSGINCGAVCSANYTAGTVVILTAVASPGSLFNSWDVGPECGYTATCILAPLNSNRLAFASFDLASAPGPVYQETANSVSFNFKNSSGPVYNGNPSLLTDGNWGTAYYDNPQWNGVGGYYEFSYAKGQSSSAVLIVKDGSGSGTNVGTYNLTVPASCWSYNPNTLYFKAVVGLYNCPMSSAQVSWQCRSSSGWTTMRTGQFCSSYSVNLYEEGLWLMP